MADCRWLILGLAMFKLSVKQHDRYTAELVYHTVMTIGMLVMKTFRSRTRRLWGAFGRQISLFST